MSKSDLETLSQYTDKDWEAFKKDGMGGILFRFLEDVRQRRRNEALALFDGGGINAETLPLVQKMQMTAGAAEEILSLELGDIKQFYEEQNDEL